MVTRDEELKWAYLLDPCFELTNSAGKPLTDGYLEVYIAGTRNKYYCASDFAGTLHPFQIPLDSLGSNIVLADPDNAYDVYVYNRFGSLVMSRYNVTPADGGAVISNTERINELEELVVSAVTGLQGQIDDINEALDGKKDKQEEYTVTLTPSQTVSAIIQDENGQLQVITQEIALPDSVPNVNIVSPASTLTVSSVYDPATNTNTFNIDISDTGTLEYGQYMNTSDITTGAVLTRIKGNLNTTLDGKIKLTGGKSYHITVRGTYVTGEAENTVEPLQYVEYVSNSRIKVDVDNTVTEEQHFELSYDLFKLAADTDYYVSFLPSSGKVTELTVEVHSLSSFNAIGQGGSTYEQGWGIIIDNDTISVDPTILDQYTTAEEVTEIVSSVSTILQNEIDNITGGVQADWEQDDPAEPDYIKNKPDLDIYATNDMVTSVSSTLVEMIDEVSGNIPELPEEEAVEFQEINLDDYALASAIPDLSGYAETSTVIDMVSTVSTVLQDEIDNIHIPEYQAGDYISIENDTISVTGLQPEGDYATREELVTAVSAVSANIPDAQVQSDWTESDDTKKSYIQHKPEVKDIYAGPNIILTDTASGLEISALGTTDTETVSAIAKEYADAVSAAIPDAQVQSDWTQDDTTKKDYIKHKPIPKTLVAGQNITITDTVTGLEISSTGGGGGGTTYTAGEGIDITDNVISIDSTVAKTSDIEGLEAEIQTVSSTIPELPDEEEVDFEEIDLTDYALASAIPTIELNGDSQVTAIDGHTLAGGGGGSTYTAGTGIDITNDVISVNSDVAMVSDIPEEINLVAGQNISIAVTGASAIISSTGGGGTTYTAGDYIDITDDIISVTGLDNSNIFWCVRNSTTFAEAKAAYDDGKTLMLKYNGLVGTCIKASSTGFGFIIPKNFSTSSPEFERISLISSGWSYWTSVYPNVQADWNTTNSSNQSYIKNKPDLSTYATVASVTAVADSIPEIELNGNDQVTAIDGHELAGSSGSSYTPGTGIDITNDIISVNADVATKTWVGNQGYLTSIPANYVTDTELNGAVSGFATKTELTNGLNNKQNTLTGITDVQVVQSLPASPVATVLYLIPEA